MSVTLHRFRSGARANEATHAPLTHAEKAAMIRAAATKLEELFDVLRIDHRNDHNTRDTPRRVAKMYVEDLMNGRFSEPPAITAFENVGGFAELIMTGPIEVRSTCAHHLMPIYGEAFVGVLPQPGARSSDFRSTTGSWTTSPPACRFRRSWSSRSVPSLWRKRRPAASPSASMPSTCARPTAASVRAIAAG